MSVIQELVGFIHKLLIHRNDTCFPWEIIEKIDQDLSRYKTEISSSKHHEY